jgi:hypothetical protein
MEESMADTVPTEQALEQTRGFRWGEVHPTRERRLAALAAPAEPDLGGIAGFIGTFRPEFRSKRAHDVPKKGV